VILLECRIGLVLTAVTVILIAYTFAIEPWSGWVLMHHRLREAGIRQASGKCAGI